jgi:DNA-directed RNA polymerase subunit alpha
VSSCRAARQDLLDIRNFGSKSIDEVKAKLAGWGWLKDSPPGFDPASIADTYADDYDDLDEGRSLAEDEQF